MPPPNVRKASYLNVFGQGGKVFEERCTITTTVLAKASWVTRGKGFGRRSGWLVPGKFEDGKRDTLHVSSARQGKHVVPGTGGVDLGHGRMLDLKNGEIVVQKKRCAVEREL